MSKQSVIQYLLTAKTQDFVAGVGKGKKAMKAFNKATGRGTQMVASMRNQMLQLVGAAAGLSALSSANRIMIEASAAGYNLEASLKAANRQFDIGSPDQWKESLSRLNDELKVYSESALQNAAARTIDMTKRLGLSTEQMEQLISATANLSAGKTDLENGIERTTAALRGEAEASEYLGLTLNETYVKGWHEAHNAHNIAWKDLTDLEKAQVRFNVLMEQAAPLQGRAAESINTYAGALQLIKKEITDNIAQNDNLVQAMVQVGAVLRDNAEAIGDTIGALATGAAKIIEFIAQNHEMIIEVGKWGIIFGVAYKALMMLVGGFNGVNAAVKVMTGTRLLPWFTQLISGTSGGVVAVRSLAAGFGTLGLAVGAFYAAYKFGHWLSMRKEIQGVADALKDLEEQKKFSADISAEIGAKVGMPGASVEDIKRAEKAGTIKQDKDTGEWSRVEKESPVSDAFPSNQQSSVPDGLPRKKLGQKQSPGESGYAGTDAWQEYQDIIGAGLTMDAAPDGMTKAELAEFAKASGQKSTPVNQTSDTDKMLGIGEKISSAWENILSGEITGIDNIKRQLQQVNPGHQVRDVQIEDAGQTREQTPVKTVRLEFPGGHIQDREDNVEALLSSFSAAGMRA